MIEDHPHNVDEPTSLIAQDLACNRVHAFLGGQHFDGWLAAIAVLEGLPYTTILPGHGQPGDRGLYCDARAYLTAAPASVAEADGPDDLNRRLVTAFPATAAPPCGRCRATSLTPGHR